MEPLIGARGVGRLLLTGVPGWFTDRLAAALVREPWHGLSGVRCLVHPASGLDRQGYRTRVGLDTEVAFGDLADRAALETAVRGIDTVIHAAGVIHVRRIREFFSVNTDGTGRLAEAAAAAGVTRFVFISSNAAGGRSRTAEHLLTEDDAPIPLGAYGRSKWQAEEILARMAMPMERVVLRPCMFYGPPVPDRHSDIYRRILDGRMPLVGDGKYARSVTHIDHLVQAARLAAEHPAAAGRTYYVADREVHTTRAIIEAMARALGVTPRYLRLPRVAGPLAGWADLALSSVGLYWQNLHILGEAHWHVGVSIERACRELGYAPRSTLDEGMREAVEWCREHGKLR